MKKLAFLSGLFLLSGFFAKAQTPTHPKYVKEWGDSEAFSRLYGSWRPGTPFSTEAQDDEEFYISRVKPHKRFIESTTQVDKNMSTDRKLFWWVPIGVASWNAIPSYYFNSEVFSTWSYIDHWGNWTASYIRMPGAFADVAHKNGVSVTATASVGFGQSVYDGDQSWGTRFRSVIDGGVEKYIKFLQYYGVDGAGYNSEFNFSRNLNNDFKNFLGQVSTQTKTVGFDFYSNDWYGITDNNGGMGGSWDALDSNHASWFGQNNSWVSNHYFLNYNWSSTHLTTSEQTARSLGRSTYDVYAGINMQRGAGFSWSILNSSKTSIGIWGAHNANMIYENRGGAGASPFAQQNEYQKASEAIFTGGYRNPLKHHPMGGGLPGSSGAAANFMGISNMMVARSALSWDIEQEPFVTYFNLGNGVSFNINGQKAFDGEWYNIGMQDYMPTWRWWFSKTFMGRGESEMPTQNVMDAKFTWDDAWFGGSCLQIFGKSGAEQYLQLFKTKYAMKEGFKITVRYKVVAGSGDIDLCTKVDGEETNYSKSILEAANVEEDNWVEKTIEIKSSGRNSLNISGKTLAMIGLCFKNTTDNFAVRIGEISVVKADAYTTPSSPRLVKSISLDNSFKGADFKVVYSMDQTPKTEKTFNIDVNTWYFKIYSQQEGEKEEFCTATTSWAAYVVGAKINPNGARKMRYGVSAVSLDGKTESPIVWGEYQALNTPKIQESIVVNKSFINPGNSITFGFEDPNHPDAQKWEVLNSDNQVVQAISGGKKGTVQLSDIGIYNLKCTLADGSTSIKESFVTVIPVSAGNTPEIQTLKANNKEVGFEIHKDDIVNMSYTANNSNGRVSRALRLSSNSFKIKNLYSQCSVRLGSGATSPTDGGLTVSFWFKPDNTVFPEGEDGMRLMDIAREREGWPRSEWSYFWVNYGGGRTQFGRNIPSYRGFSWTNMSLGYDANDAREKYTMTNTYDIKSGTWCHVTIVLGYDLSKRIYVNGKLLDSAQGSSTRSSLFENTFSLNISRFVKFGYTADGYLDEVRVYNKALQDSDIPGLMTHLNDTSAEVAKGLKAYFDFEDEATAGGFRSKVGNVTANLSTMTWVGEGNQVWTDETKYIYGPSMATVEGTSQEVTTTAKWSTPNGKFTNIQGNDHEGSANVKWSVDGQSYPVVLRLENAWGSDTKTFNVIKVLPTDEVSFVDMTVYPNPFVENIRINFAMDGMYDMYLYDMNGCVVGHDRVQGTTGCLYTMNVNAPKGFYVLKIMKDGKHITSVKMKKQ